MERTEIKDESSDESSDESTEESCEESGDESTEEFSGFLRQVSLTIVDINNCRNKCEPNLGNEICVKSDT